MATLFRARFTRMRKNCQLQSGMVWALICPSHAARFRFSVSESGVHSFSGAVRMPQAMAAIST